VIVVLTDNELEKIYEWYGALVRSNWTNDWIPELQQRIQASQNHYTTSVFEDLLISEYQRQERYREAMAVINKQILERSDDPVPRIKKASQLLYYEEEYTPALAIIDEAISIGSAAKRFVFQANGVKARIGVELGRPDIVRQAILEMMKWDPNDTIVDIPPETDFLKRIPESALGRELIESYRSYSQHVRKVWDKKFRVT
jgi:tetratricopeptide (TPR) repeat protein